MPLTKNPTPTTGADGARTRPTIRTLLRAGIAAAGLIVALVLGFVVHTPTVWGLLPIVLYAVLSLCGTDLLLATVVSLLAGILLAQQSPHHIGGLLVGSLGDTVTLIGLIVVLGAGLGEVLRRTGTADVLVRGVLRVVRPDSVPALLTGVTLACLVLVFALGTLAGALAIAAPIILPVAARAGLTRSATAGAMFLGGCAGLALAPFAGSNIAILDASGLGYGTYVLVAAGPLALLSLLLSVVLLPRVQRRSAARGDDFYPTADAGDRQRAGEQDGNGVRATQAGEGAGDRREGNRSLHATWAFLTALVLCVGYAVVNRSGTSLPLVALPAMAAVTAAAGRLPVIESIRAFVRGAVRMWSTFLLFWMLSAFFQIVNELKPYDVLLARFGPQLHDLPGLPFAVAVALLGWLGVPGATAAHVVLLNKVFGPLGTSVGLTPAAWAVTYLWGSKADTYGPFPNANMMSVLGFAESSRLRNLLALGWLLLIPAAALYVVILALLL